MQILNRELNINFLGWRKIAAVLSALIIVTSISSLVIKNLNYGLEFTGGTEIELEYPDSVSVEDLRSDLDLNGFGDAIVQYFGTARNILIKVPLSEEHDGAEVSNQIYDALDVKGNNVEIRSVGFIGPQYGQELVEKGLLALVYALIAILAYVAFRFEWKFSVGAVAALAHDVIITLGVFSIFQMEFTLPVLAALLAVIGYSLNDTIVVFDRIRENFRKLRETDNVKVMNISINQTLPRTILTSLTTLLVLAALFVYGGEALKGFASALIIGVLVGTYSSIFIASPTVLALGVQASDLIPEEVEKEGADQPNMYI